MASLFDSIRSSPKPETPVPTEPVSEPTVYPASIMYRCDEGTKQCVEDSGGMFKGEADCKESCGLVGINHHHMYDPKRRILKELPEYLHALRQYRDDRARRVVNNLNAVAQEAIDEFEGLNAIIRSYINETNPNTRNTLKRKVDRVKSKWKHTMKINEAKFGPGFPAPIVYVDRDYGSPIIAGYRV